MLISKNMVEKSKLMRETADGADDDTGRVWVKVMDALLWLQTQPLPWDPTRPDDVKECARSIITYFCTCHFKGEPHVRVLALAFDAADFMTMFRSIVQKKRGQHQGGRALGRAMGRCKEEATIVSLGGYTAVLKDKHGLYARLMKAICWHLKNRDVDDGWDPSDYIPKGCALLVVGGFEGGIGVAVNGRSVEFVHGGPVFRPAAIATALKAAEQQGEGEGIMWVIGRRLVDMVVEQDAASAASMAIEYVSYDVDALPRGMAEIHRLQKRYEKLDIPTTLLRMCLTVHSKSATVLRKLGFISQQQDGGSLSQATADGRSLYVMIDLLSMYASIECDPGATFSLSHPMTFLPLSPACRCVQCSTRSTPRSFGT